MEIRQLECFVVCVNAGSFSKAAEILYLNQSNVSRMIRSMEEELNTTLFLRSSKGLVMTLEGERIFEKSKDILERMKELNGTGAQTPLESFSVATFPSNFVAYAFAKLIEHYEQEPISFNLTSASTSDILRQVEEKEADIGFLYYSESQKPILKRVFQNRNLEYVPLCNARPCLYIGNKNPLLRKSSLSDAEIHSLHFMKISYDYMDNFHDMRNTARHYGIEEQLNNAVVIGNGYGMIQMLNNTDICYLGHAWFSSETDDYIGGNTNLPIYDNKILLKSYDGQITVGYVKRIGQTKNRYIWELLQTLTEDIIKNF